jgi:pSer/pThr/pTyr-binding forkhead associated (FHA) protein
VPPSGRSWIDNDLGTTKGIKVKGRRVEGPQSLKRGDVIEIGTSKVTFEVE